VSDLDLFGGPIVTGEAVAVDLRPAGAGSRGVAFLVDLAIVYGLLLLLTLVASNLVFNLEGAAGEAVLLTSTVLIVLGYPVLLETLWRGRTLGKAMMGLRVVRDDGGPIRFRHAFVRGLVGVVLDRPGLSMGLLALVPMLASSRSKRIGDLAAGTVVVQERVPSRVAAPPPMPPGLESWARSLDLSRLNDALALEVRQFLARNQQLAPWARQEMGDRLLGELVGRIGPPPPGVPPGVYFAAVLAERRRRDLERFSAAAPSPPSTPIVTPPSYDAPPTSPPGPFAPPR
jgi:uncharacterized RDD family membrane protein YckC